MTAGEPMSETSGWPSPSRLAEPLAGTSYRAVNLLADGGMSQVYCAEHRLLGHLVAVKVRRSARPDPDARWRDRVRIEGQAGARLRHHNLVAVHDFGTTSHGDYYLAMELLRGESLYERLTTEPAGRMAVDEALNIACQLLTGLQLIHDSGLVHRDIKPANVFLCEDGTVKLLDLGFAKVVARSSSLTPDPLVDATEAGVVIGSPRYMAPEQASSDPVDGRADLYALGCTVYRMLCGRGPFDDATTSDEMRAAHLSRQPRPPSSFLSEPLPPGLDALILRCLHKSPEGRPSRAGLVREALRRIAGPAQALLAVAGAEAFQARRYDEWSRRMHRNQLLLIVLASLTLGALVGGWLSRLRWS